MNIEHFKIQEKIKLSYLKHRGNPFNVLKELGLPEDEKHIKYIKKLIEKFKKKESKEVSTLIADNLMAHILFGYQSRVQNLMEVMKVLDGKNEIEVSICCEAPFRERPNSNPLRYECLSCHLICDVKKLDKEGMIDLKLATIEQLREEDATLIEFAEKMGYTNKIEPPTTIINNKQNVLVLGEGDKKIITEIENLHPMEREKLLERLEREIKKLPDDPIPFETPNTNI